MMDQALPLPPASPRLHLVPALLWRLALVCLLGTLALLPFDLTFFIPSAPSFFDTFTVWYGPHGLILTSWHFVIAEALCLLLMLAAVGLDRRLRGQVSA